MNASDILAFCKSEFPSSNCTSMENAAFSLHSMESVVGCREAKVSICQALEGSLEDTSCLQIGLNFSSCLLGHYHEVCQPIECDEDNSWFETSGGKLLLMTLAVALLLLFDFTCEKRHFCTHFFSLRIRQLENPRERQEDTLPVEGSKPEDSSQQSSTCDVDNISARRIDSLRDKRRSIEQWLDNHKEQGVSETNNSTKHDNV